MNSGLQPAALRPAIFLDKDGTLLENVPFNVDPVLMRWTAGADRALRRLADTGLPLIVVTNQPGVALGYFAEERLRAVEDQLRRMFAACGAELTGFYYCPHAPYLPANQPCICRKPQPGLLRRAARNHAIDLERSWMVGDILDDVEAGRVAGCRGVLLDNGNETEWRLTPARTPDHTVTGMEAAAALIADAVQATSHTARRERSPEAQA